MKNTLRLSLIAMLFVLAGLYSCKKTESKPEATTPEPTSNYYTPAIPLLRIHDNYNTPSSVPTNIYFRTRSNSELIDSISLGTNLYIQGHMGGPGDLCSGATGGYNTISLKAIVNKVFTMEACAVKNGTLAIFAYYNFDENGNIQNAGPSTTSIYGSKGYKSQPSCDYIGLDF